MYEGFSSDVLNRALPDGLGLRVVSGFARDGHGRLSGQLDCMVVRGEGERLSHADSYVWHVRDIVAVVEVKENLHSAELRDAFGQLNSVSEIEHAYYQGDGEVSDDPDRNMAPSVRTFAEMTGKLAWGGKGAVARSYEEDALLQTLLMEQISAVRVILGMHGFKSERAFRLSMANCLEKNCRAARIDGRGGWQVQVHNAGDEALDVTSATEQWSPNFIGEEEFVLLTRLCQGREVRCDDPEMLAWLESRGVEFCDVRNRLLETRFVASSG